MSTRGVGEVKALHRRVVITGIGVLAPNGNDLETFWRNTLDARSGIAPITRFPVDEFPVKIAGEIKNFTLEHFLPSDLQVKPRRMGWHTQLGIAATHMALHHAGLRKEDLHREEPIIVNLGVSTSAIDVIERGKEVLMQKGPHKVSPYIVGACQPHAVACEIVETLGFRSRRSTFASACPAGLEAVARSMEQIQAGEAGMVICGGVDAPITPLTMASFHLAGMIKDYSFPPGQSSRPFDARRQGGVAAEGACCFVLESLESALTRGATPYAEILGYGSYADDVCGASGSGLGVAMAMALDNSSLLPDDIDYVNAHGPSDPVLDRAETLNIKKIFGTRAYRIPISSIKGVTGNPLAAAGPLQMAASCLAMRDGLLPPTANYQFPDPDCDLNYIPNHPLPMRVDRILVNLHGLGGGNTALILQRVLTR